jgi:hypothetical protein
MMDGWLEKVSREQHTLLIIRKLAISDLKISIPGTLEAARSTREKFSVLI